MINFPRPPPTATCLLPDHGRLHIQFGRPSSRLRSGRVHADGVEAAADVGVAIGTSPVADKGSTFNHGRRHDCACTLEQETKVKAASAKSGHQRQGKPLALQRIADRSRTGRRWQKSPSRFKRFQPSYGQTRISVAASI